VAWALGLLVLAQNLLLLLAARYWLAFVRRETAPQGRPEFSPPLSLIVPCR